eukprot:Platyproteum_vivax@DN4250_c0_g1_i4.p1
MSSPEKLKEMEKKYNGTIKIICGFVIVGCLVAAAAVILPEWRIGAPMSTLRHYKRYGLFGCRGGRHQSWMQVEKFTCLRMTSLQAVGGIGAIACDIADGVVDACNKGFQMHITGRCRGYRTLKIWNLLTLSMILVTSCLSVLGNVYLIFQGPLKLPFCTAFMTSTEGVKLVIIMLWFFISKNVFDDLRTTASYPWPDLSYGFYVFVGGFCLSLVGIIVACTATVGIMFPKKIKEKEERQRRSSSRKFGSAWGDGRWHARNATCPRRRDAWRTPRSWPPWNGPWPWAASTSASCEMMLTLYIVWSNLEHVFVCQKKKKKKKKSTLR